MRTVTANGVELCVDEIGDPADRPMLLIAGTGSSMDWWRPEFCELLAAGGRRVVRYDHRDTGQSTTYPPGEPGYAGWDLTADAVGVLGALGIDRADLVGISAGCGIAQEIALEHPERVASLTLISTSFVDRPLPAIPNPKRDRTALLRRARARLVRPRRCDRLHDPLFPLGHGEALAAAIPGARLLVLDAVGHELPPESWDRVVPAILAL